MAESTIRCPKCGHEGIVITELLNADLRLIANSQAVEIKQLLSRIERLRAILTECAVALDNISHGFSETRVWNISDIIQLRDKAAKAAGGDRDDA